MRRLLAIPAAVAAAVLVTACGATERTAAIPRPTPSVASSTPPATARCSPPATASYRPSDLSVPDGSTMAKIVAKKQLVVGISADSRLLGSRNLLTGQFQGIDIEMADRVAQALFGPTWRQHLVFKTINAGQRIPLLQSGDIDMVARAMTMNCDRWKD